MKPRNLKLDRKPKLIGPICAIFIGVAFWALPLQAHGKKDVEKLMSHVEFVGVLKSISEINTSMRLAADNPMDEWRRDRVRKAIAALPSTLRSLAGVFKSNGIADAQLPLVQAMFGGFIDVNAADNYDKFLRSPSANRIPKMGSNFPVQYIKGGGTGASLVMDENAPKGQSGAQLNVKVTEELANIEAGLAAKEKQLKLSPQFFNAIPMSLLLSLLTGPEAMAECEKGEGCDNKETGNKGAEFMMGMAMMMGPIAAMGAAAAQASADKAIAKTNQQTAIATTQISADTSKYLAETQKAITDQQIATTQQIAQMNNDATTKRLEAQLGELGKARQENNQISRERRDLEYQLNQQRIDLAQRQADDNVQLAKATLSAQISQAGLSQGLSTNPGNQLAVNRSVGNTTFIGGTNAAGGLLPRTNVNPGQPVMAGQLPVRGPVQTNRAVASSQLLSTLRGNALQARAQKNWPARRAFKRNRTLRGARTNSAAGLSGSFQAGSFQAGSYRAVSRELAYALRSNLDVIGSLPDRRSGSDVSVFQAQVPASASTFAGSRRRSVASGSPEAVPHAVKLPNSLGYNPPAGLVMEGSTHSMVNGTSRGFFKMPMR